MAAESYSPIHHSNAYNIFILVLTVLSLGIMVVMLLPVTAETTKLLQVYDNVICVLFLFDFFNNLRLSPKKSDYFIRERGWLDLLGSIPSFGFFKNSGLLRLFRLSRLARITRLLRGKNKDALVKDIIENRSKYTGIVTLLMTLIVLTVASVMVLQFESMSSNGNIKTGGDALWYSIVTITTVGYGDRFPVTPGGRITAVFIMFMGVGIIGVLASILSSLLVGGSPEPEEEDDQPAPAAPAMQEDLAAIKSELLALRQLVESMTANGIQK